MSEALQKTSTAVAAHYVWGTGCDGWRLVQSAGLSVIEERMPAGTQEQRHFHREARQFFYVLEGELMLVVEDQVLTLEAGEGLEIPPGLAHEAINGSTTDVRFLVISQPPSHGDRVQADAR